MLRLGSMACLGLPASSLPLKEHSVCSWNIYLPLIGDIREGRQFSFAKPEAEGDVSVFGAGPAAC